MLKLRGEPPLPSPPLLPSSSSISKREREMEVRHSAKSLLSEGWMYWSTSGGDCSRTRAQKLGILEMVAARWA